MTTESGALLYSIGVCVPEAPPRNVPRTTSYSNYIHEILGHAGLCYRAISSEALTYELSRLKVLVTVGNGELSEDTQAALQAWVQNGGAWLAVGGTCGMHTLFGLQTRQPQYTGVGWGGQSATLGEGYLDIENTAHPVLKDVPLPLHFFNGIAVQGGEDVQVLAGVSNAHQHPSPFVGISEKYVGKGRCFLIGPDVVGTVVRIQQGVAVTRDGVSAADGSGTLSDGVLKCDDGMVLDWTFDRQDTPDAPGLRCFLEPIADHWRALLLRSIFYLAGECDVPLAMLWLYPRNLPAVAHLSHDSDGNDPELARRLLEVTREENVHATWCIILPGHEPALIDAIQNDGHEIATHYDAMDYDWSEAEFDSQWKQLCEQFGEQPVSNKNHYTRWEGDTEFFEWCEKRGIQMDGSKGPSKWGEAGFTFGTCLPYYPVAPDGRVLDVLEVPFLSQDLGIFIAPIVTAPFIRGVLRAHGVLHMLFHPSHIPRPEVENALRTVVRSAREAGLEWWTSREINNWERARRGVQWSTRSGDNEAAVTLHCTQLLSQATVLFSIPKDCNVVLDGVLQQTKIVRRWGWEFQSIVTDLAPGGEYTLQVLHTRESGRAHKENRETYER